MSGLGLFFDGKGVWAEAEPLMRRAMAIDEASFGPEHPNVGRDLNNLAALLQATDRLAEAESLMRRAIEILQWFTAETGHPQAHLRQAIENYEGLLAQWASTRQVSSHGRVRCCAGSVFCRAVDPSKRQRVGAC